MDKQGKVIVTAKRSKRYLARRKMQLLAYDLFGPKIMTQFYYRHLLKKKLHLSDPKTFTEKVCWYKLEVCPKSRLIIQCSDKYLVRNYIESKGYGDDLPKLYGVWKDANEINFDLLPDRFALKCNHGCAYNIICDNKLTLDRGKARALLNQWMHEDFGKYNGEPHYDKIPKRIICEEYLDTSDGFLPNDYKVHCFNGKPGFILKCYERGCSKEEHSSREFYDINGNHLDYCSSEKTISLGLDDNMLEKILSISEDIARDFQFVRVDFYIWHGNPVIGELTFSPGGGYSNFSEIGEREAGNMWDIR